MTEEEKKVTAERIKEAIGSDTQTVAAKKINSNQGAISNLIKGDYYPTSATIIEICKAYNVSADWLLGLSDNKYRNSINIDYLTYDQVMEVVCSLFETDSIEVPNIGSEVNPEYDPTLVKFKDPLFTYLLTRRYNASQVGNDILEDWKKNSLSKYQGIEVFSAFHWNETGRTPEERMRYNDDIGWLIELQQIETLIKQGWEKEEGHEANKQYEGAINALEILEEYLGKLK
jgi:transcriptional regulator with XRE-family HTH domain